MFELDRNGWRMKEKILVILAVIVCLGTLAFLPDFINSIGTSEKNLLSYDIEMSKVSAGYRSVMAVTDDVAAILHYNNDKTDYDFSVYVNYPGFDFGYHFRTGGSISDIETGVAVLSNIHEEGTILLSLNKPQVSRIEIYGAEAQIIGIDENEPFVVIVPSKFEFKIFDINNNETLYRPL